ncbi:retrotransposon gag protein [Cucumis melo var. makuwa]|uniref:Retrotransposon gag protein n=1 Tax=Cucumis melo var. makuwa TaxID=1194695 RepID=A0A5A7TJV9_CUCMM|nr:retrotransposon gag protein [Cucumis melo var. makuwa]TYK29757.1 retrotransposon gag protein [Cucumis melo var. makuwa]
MQEQEQSFILIKKSWKQLMKSTNDRIAITENTLSDNSAPTSDQPEKESHLEVVSVMMTDITAEAVMGIEEAN